MPGVPLCHIRPNATWRKHNSPLNVSRFFHIKLHAAIKTFQFWLLSADVLIRLCRSSQTQFLQFCMIKKPIALFSVVCLCGCAVLAYSAHTFHLDHGIKFVLYLLMCVFASRFKVRLPGIDGSISVNFLFILLGIVELNFSQTVAIGCVATLAQIFRRWGYWPKFKQVAFNVCNAANAIFVSYFFYQYGQAVSGGNYSLFVLILAACIYFLGNTLPVACIICFTEHKKFRGVWKDCFFWYFPYYLVGALISGLVSWANGKFGWQTSLLALPAMFVIYRSFRMYLAKLANEKQHSEAMAGLHLRTIEALAMAIEAKDQTTHDHLQRVRVYAIELAKLLVLPFEEVEALRAAALLHDIGKLAVPEHIISKPGRLTPEEFEKMKIHPVVGAEILERVQFPYPVVPIVRSHHEKWDGSGYPAGLKGKEIPVGARILAVVDTLDALASDRQYRKALPLDEAMQRVVEESGKAFDPEIVALLKNHFVDLEEIVRSQSGSVERQKLSTDLKIERGLAPAAGFERRRASEPPGSTTFLASIAAARHEAQTLFELSHELGNSLSLDETLSVLAVRLKRLVPFDSVATYIVRGDELVPEHVSGDNIRLFDSLRIPMGQGLSGWVAQNRKSIVNGNPSVEPGYVDDPGRFNTLLSAISVPLEGLHGVVGVMTLYHSDPDAYTSDHLRILMAISSKVALSVENALAFRVAESSATTDFLTELPNARSLFLHLDKEIARSRRSSNAVTVMVCDLNGFKQINDRFGHLEGNRILKLFARSLQGSCREYDYVARMGGDEFVIIAPGLSMSAAVARGICLSEMATAAGREVCGEDLLSLSMGVAIFPQDGADAEKLLAEADRRMYSEKQEHYSAKKSVLLSAAPVNDPVHFSA
jgi:diguanylate cyclase (GGDEF)-like protein/putative nucleotidyltransferase with HDIG domain